MRMVTILIFSCGAGGFLMMLAYLKHPAHCDYVKVVRDRREKVVVFDYWTGQ